MLLSKIKSVNAMDKLEILAYTVYCRDSHWTGTREEN
jgi:hypothetical protein